MKYQVLSWGGNNLGQCGIVSNTREEYIVVPSLIPHLLGLQIVTVTCGAAHSMAITANGILYSWGAGGKGQLGSGRISNESEPKKVEGIPAVEAVACGIFHTLVLCCNKRLYGFGGNSYGELGLGIKDVVLLPNLVPLDTYENSDIMHIACGGGHSLLVDSGGSLFAAGSNTSGQLGQSSVDDSSTFEQIIALSGTPIAFVACGEEYSCAISYTRQVFTWGLGIAGQLGNGELNNCSTPGLLSELNDKGVESIACSQSQVFAICADGAVFTWGLNMDTVHLNFLEFSSLDKSSFVTRPIPVPSFTKKRRARMFSCGRKHYCLITMGVYGPNSYLMIGNKEISAGEALIYDAGSSIKLMIQACDEYNKACSNGGSLLSGVISSAEKKFNPFSCALTIDDDLDGKYSTRFKLERAGKYELAITIDGVHIRGSPFEVHIQPLSPSLDNSFITCDSHQSTVTCMLKETLNYSIHLRDEFMNQVAGDYACGINCRRIDGTTVFTSEMSNDTSISFLLDFAGLYTVHGWISDRGNEISSSYQLSVVDNSCSLSAQNFTFSIPESATAGISFHVRICTDPKIFKSVDAKLMKVIFKPLNHSLSPRAIVRYGGNFNPLSETHFLITADKENSMLALVDSLNIAGDYLVTISYSSLDIYSTSFLILHSNPSTEYTEVINTHLFFSDWIENTEKMFSVQIRDKYGNRVLSTDDKIEAYIKRVQGNSILKTFDVLNEGSGIYTCRSFLDIAKQTNSDYVVHIKLNDKDIFYSPFSIEFGPHNESSDVSDFPPIIGKASQSFPHTCTMIDKFDITRHRALEVLKKEQRKFAAEREERRKKQSIKRTGGGFLVKFSNEI